MKNNRDKSWSEEDKQFVRVNWETMTDKEMANCLGRSRTAVALMRQKLGLTRSINYVTDEEKEFIKLNLGKMTYKEMAEKLNRPLPSIYTAARKIDPSIVNSHWETYSKKEASFLEVNWKTMSIYELAETLDKSPRSIVSKLLREGLLDGEE